MVVDDRSLRSAVYSGIIGIETPDDVSRKVFACANLYQCYKSLILLKFLFFVNETLKKARGGPVVSFLTLT